jgi:hypothetical protein
MGHRQPNFHMLPFPPKNWLRCPNLTHYEKAREKEKATLYPTYFLLSIEIPRQKKAQIATFFCGEKWAREGDVRTLMLPHA